MSVIVRKPSLTDAAGAGMAHALTERQQFAGRVPDDYWATHTEETAMQYWHDIFGTRVQGRRIALGVTQRRVVAMCGIHDSGSTDRSGALPARSREIFYFAALSEYADPDVLQRMFDFVLPTIAPCQCWVWREDQVMRRFLRMNGFTLDGLTTVDPASGLEYSRLVR